MISDNFKEKTREPPSYERVLRLIKKDGSKKGGQFSDKVHNSIEYIFIV